MKSSSGLHGSLKSEQVRRLFQDILEMKSPNHDLTDFHFDYSIVRCLKKDDIFTPHDLSMRRESTVLRLIAEEIAKWPGYNWRSEAVDRFIALREQMNRLGLSFSGPRYDKRQLYEMLAD